MMSTKPHKGDCTTACSHLEVINTIGSDKLTQKIYKAMQIGYLSERHDAIKKLIANEVQAARRSEEQYWIDGYSRQIKALDGFDDSHAIEVFKAIRKEHQERLAQLQSPKKEV